MADLIDGGDWWAQVREEGEPDSARYWKVIAWERVSDIYGSKDGGLVAWLNGRHPVRSDLLSERSKSWDLVDFVTELPSDASVSSYS